MSEIRVPDGWIQTTLGENLQIDTGSKNAEDSKEDGTYPFFTRAEETQKIDTYSYDTEALFIAGDGNFRVKYYNGKFEVHQRTYILRKKTNEIDLQFLQKAIQPQIYKLISTSVGSTVKSLRKPQIAEIGILIPKSKKEQQKIAEILSEVDSAITLTKELIEKNKRLKTALMQDLLSYGIDENGQIRSPQTHKFKPSPLGDIPVEWECIELGKYVDINSGKSPSNFILTNAGIPYFKVEQMNNTDKYLDKETPYFFQTIQTIQANSIIFAKRGEAIFSNKIRILLNDSYFDTNIMSLTPNEYLNSNYLFYLLTYIKLEQVADTTSIPQINNKHINPFKIIKPELMEQQKIANILSSQDEKIEKLQNKLTKLNHLKTSLMQDLLSGKVRVNKLLESKQ